MVIVIFISDHNYWLLTIGNNNNYDYDNDICNKILINLVGFQLYLINVNIDQFINDYYDITRKPDIDIWF